MKNQELHDACIAKLRLNGVKIADRAKSPSICTAIGKSTGTYCAYNMSMTDFMQAYLAPQKATAYVTPFKKMRPHAHPRLTEIECLPRQVSMSGVGNGNGQGYGRGR